MVNTFAAHRGRSSRVAACALAVAAVLAACGSTPAPTPAEAASVPTVSDAPSASAGSPSPLPTSSPDSSASPSPSPSASATPAGANLLGTDGRFTILLLGSDYRPSSPGNRTDAIMVISLNPATGAVAAFSVPRDTTGFPLPEGGKFGQKVNGLYQWYQSRNGHGMASLKNAISKAYGVEIDYGVLTGFTGVRNLVSAVGGVQVTLAKAYYDPIYWVNSRTQGWGLSAGTHQLSGETALIFARSRKGDNDFNRARRQQQLVSAAVTKVLAKGSSILPKLLAIATGKIVTDLPLDRSLDLYSLVATAKLSAVKSAVFGPRSFAYAASGTSFTPNIPACRAWVKKYFPPANPGASWPAQS